jgi:hypothetical protein
MASKTISFRIFLHDQLIDTRSFAQDVIKLGRLASSHLRLEHEAIARMHAVIEVGQDGSARLVDLGSHSGTRLNGSAIDRSSALRSGDKLEIGPYRLELVIADAMPALEPAVNSTPVARPTANVELGKVEDPREQVAEVVAVYGRSIVDVAHVGQARDRKRSAMPLLALGGVLMAGGLGLFGYEVAQPWDEHGAAVAEAAKMRREAPEAPGLGTGSLGMVLALLGVVPFLAGNLRLREQPLTAYTIGEGREADFHISGATLPNPAATPLVERVDGGYALAFTPAMTGAIDFGNQQVSLAELVASGHAVAREGAYVYPLPANAKARIEHGDVRFNVSLVNRGAVVAGRGEVDWPFMAYFGGTATIATAFFMLMKSMPDDALAFQIEDADGMPRYAAYFHQADEEVEVEAETVEPDTTQVANNESGGTAGSRAPGSEGQAGNPSSRNPSGAFAMRGPKDAVPQMARTFDPSAAARNAGILGILAAQDSHFLASVNGGAFAVGNDDADLWGNVVGLEAAEAYGVGGLGLIGSGRGGGDGRGLIGIGGAGLIGHGTGTDGLSYGPGSGGVVGFNKRDKKIPNVIATDAKVSGDIDKDLIRRIVRAHINEVRSCYNAGLTRNPNLDGRVLIQFSIVGNGKVASSVVQENTTKDKQVGDCIAKAVKRWKFPRVGKGGTALVSYPFRLSPG